MGQRRPTDEEVLETARRVQETARRVQELRDEDIRSNDPKKVAFWAMCDALTQSVERRERESYRKYALSREVHDFKKA